MHWRGPQAITVRAIKEATRSWRGEEKRHDGEKEREIRAQERGSNGRKWLSFRACKARSTSAGTPQVWGGKHAISASVKDFLFTINESQRFGCAPNILQFLLSLTLVFRDIVLIQIADLIGKNSPLHRHLQGARNELRTEDHLLTCLLQKATPFIPKQLQPWSGRHLQRTFSAWA